MSKRKFFKEGNRLYTPYECKEMNINTKKYPIKKVFRSIDEITDTQLYGRIDIRSENAIALFSTKQLRNRKVAKQMIALGLLV